MGGGLMEQSLAGHTREHGWPSLCNGEVGGNLF